MSSRRASLIGPLIFALLIVVAGVSMAAWIAVKQIPSLMMEADRGLLPDGFEATIPTEGEYTVWLHVQGRLGNQLYEGARNLPPGGKVFLFDAASGRQVEVGETVAAEKNMGEDRAVSLGVFESERAGQTVEVKGVGLNTPVLVSISHTSSGQIMRIVLLIASLILGAVFVATLVFVKLTKHVSTAVG